MNRWFIDNGYDLDKIWADIEDVIIKTIISCHPVLKQNYRSCFPHTTSSSACFEITGFDVILDHKLKPWLIEVNHSPSYHTDAQLDKEIKEGMLTDALRLLNMGACDRRKCMQEEKRRVKERLMKSQKTKSSQLMSAETSSNKLGQVSKEPNKDSQRTAESDIDVLSLNNNDDDDGLMRFEDENCGGFRRIYPKNGNIERYAKFFNQCGSLYTETAAAKARHQCVKNQLDELAAKQRREEQFRSQLKQAPRDFSKVVKQRRMNRVSSTVPSASVYLPVSLYRQKQLLGCGISSSTEDDTFADEDITKAVQDVSDTDRHTVPFTVMSKDHEWKSTVNAACSARQQAEAFEPQINSVLQPTDYHDNTARQNPLYRYANPPDQPCLQPSIGRLLQRPKNDSHTQPYSRSLLERATGLKSQMDNTPATVATLLAARRSLLMHQSLQSKSQPLLPRHGLFKQGAGSSLQLHPQPRNLSNKQHVSLDTSPFLAISGTSAAISSKPVAVNHLPHARNGRVFPRRVPPIPVMHGQLHPTV